MKPRSFFALALAGVHAAVLLGRTTTSLCALPFGARLCARDPSCAWRSHWRMALKRYRPIVARESLGNGARTIAILDMTPPPKQFLLDLGVSRT